MISRRFLTRGVVLGAALIIASAVSFSMQGCSGPVAKVNRAENKVDQAVGNVDTRVEDAGDRAGNKASEVERKVDRVERLID